MSAPLALVAYLTMLSAISFGGIPSVLPDLHDYVVATHGWISDRDFANCFAIVQAVPGPNMILMMSFIGWKIGGLPTAMASALATFGSPCAIAYAVFGWWDRFRDAPWQQAVRRGLMPVTIGLVVAGGFVMALASDTGWTAAAITLAAIGLLLGTRLNPFWIIGAGGVLGACGLL